MAVSFSVPAFLVFPASSLAEPELVFLPEAVKQGEPLMITVKGRLENNSVKKISFGGEAFPVFYYKSKPAALVGLDLNKKPGEYEIAAEFSDGFVLRKKVAIAERKKVEAPLGIPQKLGGNTVQSQNKLAATLALENKNLAEMRTGKKSFWTGSFRFPLQENIITDDYGYSRKTGAYTIAHKGTDFRAQEGTPVMAMNRGVVRAAREYRNYGKTVVVDHGLGLMTLYMHLSEIKVNEGELVQRGQLLGLSGRTGYAEFPHLHLSVKINGVSVDPVKFVELFY